VAVAEEGAGFSVRNCRCPRPHPVPCETQRLVYYSAPQWQQRHDWTSVMQSVEAGRPVTLYSTLAGA